MTSSDLSTDELALIGSALIAFVGTAQALGHVSIIGALDYVARPDREADAFVWDVMSAIRTSERARSRVANFIGRHGIDEVIADAVTI